MIIHLYKSRTVSSSSAHPFRSIEFRFEIPYLSLQLNQTSMNALWQWICYLSLQYFVFHKFFIASRLHKSVIVSIDHSNEMSKSEVHLNIHFILMNSVNFNLFPVGISRIIIDWESHKLKLSKKKIKGSITIFSCSFTIVVEKIVSMIRYEMTSGATCEENRRGDNRSEDGLNLLGIQQHTLVSTLEYPLMIFQCPLMPIWRGEGM